MVYLSAVCPLVAESECVRAESRSFLQRVYGGALQPMLAHFLEETKLSKQDIEELKKCVKLYDVKLRILCF